MKSYSTTHIFSEREQHLHEMATHLISHLDEQAVLDAADRLRGHTVKSVELGSSEEGREPLRCHELARAVGKLFDLPHQDGTYSHVDHSWLWTGPIERDLAHHVRAGHRGFTPNVLDVYSVGRLPQVQLIDMHHMGLPHSVSYIVGREREDIDQHIVSALVRAMR